MIRILCFIVFVTVCTSCSFDQKSLQANGESGGLEKQQIPQWIQQEEFGKAWDALVSVEADDPDYARYLELRKEVHKKIEQYEESVIRNARNHIEQEQWQEALDIYQDALQKLPKSTVLKDRLAALHDLKRSRTERLERQLQVIRAEELVKSIAVYDEISAVNPYNEKLKNEVAALRKEGIALASKLSEQARSELQNGDIHGALALIELAERLSDEPSILAIGEDIRSKREKLERPARKKAKVRSQGRKKQQKAEDTDVTGVLAHFDRLYRDKDYPAAADILKNLGDSADHKQEISVRQTKLKEALRNRIEHFYEQGMQYYSQESYSLALQSWSEVLRLQPDHAGAREYSERVTRIVNKINQLREKQQGSR
ncbi:MAG: hypothetical protein L0Y38_00725 [Methylococcaceae bacterium]|nr:hypothetical protein [Methylococcaceae bacterium]MCI0667505.1 hypothetical protein [Methylococcaceae bacterium]MCI0732330.1 hypothetical protein [Methylococcaceae bacterium]